jgi:hypothetical protein
MPLLSRGATLVLASALALAGCGIVDPGNDSQADAPVATATAQQSPPDQPVREFDLAAFCDAVQPLIVPVPREYVGSADHVEDFDAVIAVAPDDLVESITIVRDHFEFDVHVSDPESQNFVNFPQDIQDTALEVDGAFREMCGEA